MQSDTNNPQQNPSSEARPESPNTIQNTAEDTQQSPTNQYLDETYTGEIEVSSPAIESGGLTTVSPDNMIGLSIVLLVFAVIILLAYKISKTQKQTAGATPSKSEATATSTATTKKTGTKAKKSTKTATKKKSTKKKSTAKKKK